MVAMNRDSDAVRPAQQRSSPTAVGSLCLHQLFEQQARRTPDHVAVVFEDHRLTYSELDRRAAQLALYLRGRGIGVDVRVGLFVERSLDTMVGIVGILKAGAAYVPVDAGYPPARIAYILEDAEAELLLTQSSLLALSPGTPQAICMESFDWSSPSGTVGSGMAARPENLAYVIYTSGSTGRPKGVCIEHRNIVNYAIAVTQRLQLKPRMNYAMVSTIAADLGNTVIFPALCSGGCVHFISQERAEDPVLLSEYFERENIDVLKITPSHLAALQSGRNPERVMPRSHLILGGESTALKRVEWLRSLSPKCQIHNHYGPTETTVGALMYRAGEHLPDTRSGTLPLGTPLSNVSVHVLTPDGQPAPVGEEGELCIGGAGVARGYLKRPELTAEKFIPDPFGSNPNARLYRSGDIARRLADGNIEFCGRVDNQVKLNGYRVALEEIEHVLREYGGVQDAVVVTQENSFGGKNVLAYVVPKRLDQPLWAHPAIHVLPDGSPVAHLNRYETDYIYNEIFVLQAYLRHGITIHDGDCIVDAGANIGLFTIFASRLARKLRILSLEPNPDAFACLKTNAEAWSAAAKCLPFGLSRENTSADLAVFEGMSLLSGFYADVAVERSVVERYALNQQLLVEDDQQSVAQLGQLIDRRLQAKTIPVRVRTLSSVIAEERLDRIDLLKLNVEKSELDILLGLEADDWLKIQQMVIEVDRSENLAPITALLQRHGFEILTEQDVLLSKTQVRYVYAIRPQEARRLIRGHPAEARRRPLACVDEKILTPATLRRYLNGRLPRYMVPQAFVLLEKFPLTTNGKLDRRALPACENMQPTRDFMTPRTGTEKALAAIWSELLNKENIGVDDDFFDLGGHSLLAIKLVSRMRDVFESDLQLRNLFEHPTVAGLAEVIDGLSWMRQTGDTTLAADDREEIVL